MSSKRIAMIVFLLWGLSSMSWAAPSNSDYSSVQTAKEKKIQALRAEELKAVRDALALRNPENRKAELYLRLAELYLEAYRADFLLEGRIHEQQLKTNPSAKLQRGRSIEDLRNGIAAAETITKLKVDHNKMDQVYYFLGYNYGELGDSKKSIYYYQKLAREFPNSVYANEGIRAVADEAFRKGDYAEARRQYENALPRTKDPAQKARIYHKLAWCYYRDRRTNDAVNTMKKAIAIAQSGEGNDKLLLIREEGLRDLAIYYAETNQVDEAIQYFRDNAGGDDKLAKVLEKLGREYERSGQTEKAKTVYDAMLKLNQQDDSSFRVIAKLIDLDMTKGNYTAALARIRRVKVPQSSDPDTQIAAANLKKQVRNAGVSNHNRYRNLKGNNDRKKYLNIADDFYTVYLNQFLTGDDSDTKKERNEIRMYLAEVKNDLGQPAQASALYQKVIQDQDPQHTKNAVQELVGSLASELKRRAASGEKPGKIPSQLERDFVEASDFLQKTMPDSQESREARLRSAQILAAYEGEKEVAVTRAEELARDYPDTPQGVLAARLWLQLDPSKNTIEEISDNKRLLAQDQKQKGELKSDLFAAGKNIRVGEIASLEKSKDFVGAAAGYEEFAKNAKTEKEAERAYIGALNAYAQAGNSEEVTRVMYDWKKRYPKSTALDRSVKSQATLFFIKGLFNDSAELFLGIGKLQKDRSSYMTSAALFDGGQDYSKAISVYHQATAVSKDNEERAELYQLAANVATSSKDGINALNEWKQCSKINSSYKAECGSQVGNYYLYHNDPRSAKAAFEEVLRIKKGPSAKSPYIAYAQFRIAQLTEKEMRNAPLQFPVERLLKAFEQRVSELKPVTNQYQRAIELGGPWGIAATERVGDLALGLADEVRRVLRDRNATDELKQALVPVAEALKKQALDNTRTAYNAALKQQILSPALPVIQDRMVDAGTNGMGRAQGPRQGIKLIGMSPDGGKLGRETAMDQVREGLTKNTENAALWIDYGNLLWGIGKPGLSKVAYERARSLKTRMGDAVNNLAVVMISDLGFENWFAANEALALLKKSLVKEPDHAAALYNVGHLFNYYRLFPHATGYFERVQRKVNIADIFDGLGVAYAGVSKKTESELAFAKAANMGMSSDRFTALFHETAHDGSACSKINALLSKDLRGFEKISVNRLKQRCDHD